MVVREGAPVLVSITFIKSCGVGIFQKLCLKYPIPRRGVGFWDEVRQDGRFGIGDEEGAVLTPRTTWIFQDRVDEPFSYDPTKQTPG